MHASKTAENRPTIPCRPNSNGRSRLKLVLPTLLSWTPGCAVRWLVAMSFLTSGLSAMSLYWPTPNTAFIKGQPEETYLQPTASGRLESALFGCTRNDGRRFHEGIDLKPLKRDRRGRASDPIFAIAPGSVAHINRVGGNSSYGIYVVVAHQEDGLEFYSLYAHLSSVTPGLKTGEPVVAGQQIGVMGNTSASIRIPHSRAHLHLEIGLRLNRRFDSWYQRQDYTEPNRQGSWNGINLQAIDPIVFYRRMITDPKASAVEVFLSESVAFRVAFHFVSPPDFLQRNPVFSPSRLSEIESGWYQIGFNAFGIPLEWHRIPDSSIPDSFEQGNVHLLEVVGQPESCTSWVRSKNRTWLPSDSLKRQLEILSAH